MCILSVMKLITARIFDNPIDAHLLKTKLESEGAQCFLHDEHMVTLDPSIRNTSGGIKLKIAESDIEKVQKLLKEIESTPYLKENGEALKCPKCGSSDFYSQYKSTKGFSGLFSTVISILMMIYPLNHNSFYKCKQCGEEFESKN